MAAATTAAGVAAEFADLYGRYFAFVWRLAARFGTPAHHREDVVQEVWMAAYRRRDSLRHDASPRAWLGTITRRIVARHHRSSSRTARRHAALTAVNLAMADAHPSENLDTAGRALASLADEQREVFVLSQIDGLSGPEIAAVIGAPLNTVYSRLRLARLRLAESLASDDGGHSAAILSVRRVDERDAPARVRSAVWAALVRPWAPIQLGGVSKIAASLAIAATTVIGVVATQIRDSGPLAELTSTRQVSTANAGPATPVGPASAANVGAAMSSVGPASAPNVGAATSVGPASAPNFGAAASVGPASTADVATPDASRTASRAGGVADLVASTRGGGESGATADPAGRGRSTEGAVAGHTSAQPTDRAVRSANPPRSALAAADDALLAEAMLLRRAEAALRASDPAQALAAVREHRSKYARGRLSIERQAAEIRALCQSGDADQAGRKLAVLRRTAGELPAVAALRQGCAGVR